MKNKTPNTYSIEDMVLLDTCMKAEDLWGVFMLMAKPPILENRLWDRQGQRWGSPTEPTPGAYSLTLMQTLKCTYGIHAWRLTNTKLYEMIYTQPLSCMPKLINSKIPTLKAIARWRLQIGR
jgi:hypothetical protein